MKDDLRYTTECFDTFPRATHSASLDAIGERYYRARLAVMAANQQGLTQTYNRFHDPDETSPDIVALRALHDAMDRAVLDAYGWTDLAPRCEFLLDREDEEEEDAAPGRRRKRPWRYRWPDAMRDAVLARLLELNATRARAEADATRAAVEAERAALAEAKVAAKVARASVVPAKASGRRKPVAPEQPDLFAATKKEGT